MEQADEGKKPFYLITGNVQIQHDLFGLCHKVLLKALRRQAKLYNKKFQEEMRQRLALQLVFFRPYANTRVVRLPSWIYGSNVLVRQSRAVN